MRNNTTARLNTMKAITYFRVSTDQQAKSGAGLEAQKNLVESYAKKNNITITESFSDEGISGAASIENRPGLIAAVSSITKGMVLLIAKRDRLGRDQLVTLGIERAIQKKGGTILSADGIANGVAASDQFMRSILDAAAAFELSLIKARTLAAMAVKRKNNQRIGGIPFGYSVNENGLLIPIQEEQLVIQKILEYREKGFSFRAIAEMLDEQNIPTKKTLKCENQKWAHQTVRSILKRQKVLAA